MHFVEFELFCAVILLSIVIQVDSVMLLILYMSSDFSVCIVFMPCPLFLLPYSSPFFFFFFSSLTLNRHSVCNVNFFVLS